MAESKLARAKRQSIKEWENIAEEKLYEEDEIDRVITTNTTCGFCDEYGPTKNPESQGCFDCPVYNVEGGFHCAEIVSEGSFTNCLAVLIYIHQF